MYKRKAKLLFLSNERGLLLTAQKQVRLCADEWLECEIVLLPEKVSVSEPSDSSLDLMIILHRDGSLPAEYQGSVPYRRWCLHGAVTELEQQICREIESMAAGMKMLSRMDS